MAWVYVPGSVASSSACVSLSATDTAASATSRRTKPHSGSSARACETGASTKPPSGMTSAPSTLDDGAARWISYLQASRASRSATHREAGASPSISGRTSGASSTRRDLATSSSRTSSTSRSASLPLSSAGSTIASPLPECSPPSWVPRIADRDGGYLPTLTTRRNQHSDSMQKWPAYRRLRALAGASAPIRFWEWMMGFPVGWTDSECSATPQYQQWRQSLSRGSREG